MPKASVSLDYVRHDLKSVPGGFVELKPMSYGAKLERMQIATDFQIEMAGKGSKTSKASLDIAQKATTLFEFKQCVGEHNLYVDDAETELFDFQSARVLEKLDPKIGDEISQLIDEMNNFTAQEEDLGN